jgi:hypothetical protein
MKKKLTHCPICQGKVKRVNQQGNIWITCEDCNCIVGFEKEKKGGDKDGGNSKTT